MRIDLNADIGEFSGASASAADEALLQTITSANIACGFHAGDPSVMRRTVRLAAQRRVAVGAHPSFHDTGGFGRREMELDPDEVASLVLYQIGALHAIARAEGVTLGHVKPHGALYNMSARRRDLADAIAQAVASFDRTLILVGLPGSELLAAGARWGLRVAAEGFADRSYEPDGSLTPRQVDGAVIHDNGHAAERAVRMVRDGRIVARDGSIVDARIQTICVHGDTRDAAALAAAVRKGLEGAGVSVRPLQSD